MRDNLDDIFTDDMKIIAEELEQFYDGISSVLPTDLYCLFQQKRLENMVIWIGNK